MDDIIFDIIQTLSGYMERYGHNVFKSLSVGCLDIFNAIFACWIVWQVIYKGLIKSDLDLNYFAKTFMTSMVISLLLSANFYVDWIYKPVMDLTNGLVKKVIISVGVPEFQNHNDIVGIVKTQHAALTKVIETMNVMMKDSSIIPGINWVASLIMRFPFMFLFIIMLCYCLDYMFKLMAMTALAPVLIVFAGFSSTRNITIAGIKMVLHGILTITISILAMGLSLYALNETLSLLPIDANGYLKAGAGWFAFSLKYWTCFAVACLSIYLQMKAITIANISGVSDGPGAAAFVAGTFATATTIAQVYTRKGLGKLGGAAGSGLKSLGGKIGGSLGQYMKGGGSNSTGNSALDRVQGLDK